MKLRIKSNLEKIYFWRFLEIRICLEQNTTLQVLRSNVASLVVTQDPADGEEPLTGNRSCRNSKDVLGNPWKLSPELSRYLLINKQ